MRARSSRLAVTQAMAGNQYLVYASAKRLVVLGGASVAFGAVGAALAISGGSVVSLALGIVALACAAFGFVALAKLVSTRNVPVIAFDADGVAFRGPFEKQYVLWSQLEGAYVVQVQRQRFVCLRTLDSDAVLAAAPAARRRMMEANLALTGAPFALPTTSTLSPEELLAVVVAYASRQTATA